MLQKSILKSIFIIALIGVIFISCQKEEAKLVKEQNSLELEKAAVPFFELAKGDSLPVGFLREKPDFSNSKEATILFTTEVMPGLKASGTASNPYGNPLTGMYISSSASSGTVPSGYIPVDLNEGAGGNWIYLKCEFSNVAYGYDMISVPNYTFEKTDRFQNDYTLITRSGTNLPANLNKGAGGKNIYFGVSKYGYSYNVDDLIRQIMIVSSTSSSITYTGWTKVDTDLNWGSGGKYIYLFYKK